MSRSVPRTPRKVDTSCLASVSNEPHGASRGDSATYLRTSRCERSYSLWLIGYTGAVSEPARYRFGDFELDAGTGELRRKGVRIRLHVQPTQVLTLLVERQGELLTREEICRALWPDGTF